MIEGWSGLTMLGLGMALGAGTAMAVTRARQGVAPAPAPTPEHRAQATESGGESARSATRPENPQASTEEEREDRDRRLRLSELGREIAERVGADEIAERLANELEKKAANLHPYQVQELCKEYARARYKRTKHKRHPEEETRLLDCAYALGQPLEKIVDIVGLVLRDAVLERRAGATPEASEKRRMRERWRNTTTLSGLIQIAVSDAEAMIAQGESHWLDTGVWLTRPERLEGGCTMCVGGATLVRRLGGQPEDAPEEVGNTTWGWVHADVIERADAARLNAVEKARDGKIRAALKALEEGGAISAQSMRERERRAPQGWKGAREVEAIEVHGNDEATREQLRKLRLRAQTLAEWGL